MKLSSLSKPHLHTIFAIFATGMALRILWAYLVPVVPVSDSYLYNEFARSLVAGRGFAFPDGSLTAYWPVGTSAVYATLYGLFGQRLPVIAVFNIFVGGILILLTYLVAERSFGRKSAAFAATAVACWPVLIQFTTILASELLFTVLVLGAVYIWGSRGFNNSVRSVAWVTLVVGASYVRPTAMPLLILLPAMQFWRDRDLGASLLSLLIAVVTAAALFSPWMTRNEALWGKERVMATNFGPNLWMGNNPASNGGYMPLPDRTFSNEVDRDDTLKAEALSFIRANPGQYLMLSARRLVGTFERETIGVAWNEPGLVSTFGPSVLLPIKLITTVYWWVFLVLGTSGGILLIIQRRLSMFDPIVVVPLLLTAVAVLVVSQDRYHLPINPFLAILSGAFITRWKDLTSLFKATHS